MGAPSAARAEREGVFCPGRVIELISCSNTPGTEAAGHAAHARLHSQVLEVPLVAAFQVTARADIEKVRHTRPASSMVPLCLMVAGAATFAAAALGDPAREPDSLSIVGARPAIMAWTAAGTACPR